MKLQRYSMSEVMTQYQIRGFLGKWVKASEAEATIKNLEAEVEQLKTTLKNKRGEGYLICHKCGGAEYTDRMLKAAAKIEANWELQEENQRLEAEVERLTEENQELKDRINKAVGALELLRALVK